MKKIEEYETKDTAGRSPEEIFVEECIANKLNEVIFRLNQSVSQPEMSTNTMGLLPEEKRCQQSENNTEGKTLEKMQDEFDREKVRDYAKVSLETYKQATQDNTEEWKKKFDEEFKGKILEEFEYATVDGTDLRIPIRDNIKEFIEQLLSERSFSKEELEIIKEQVISASVDRKVDRLLSLEK